MALVQFSSERSAPKPTAEPPRPPRKWKEMARRVSARLPVYLADLREDPKWLLMFVAGRVVMVRRAVSLISRSAPPSVVPRDTIFPALDTGAMTRELRKDGVSCGIRLPEPVVRGICEFASRTECFGNIERGIPFLAKDHLATEAAIGRPILVGHFLDKIEQCPELDIVRRDPCLSFIAKQYLGAKAIAISSRLWWSFPSKTYDEAVLKRASQERFHFDMNDWGSVKFFFYLTDVDDDSGPHVYVRESHRHKRLRHQLTLFVGKPDAEILDFYGAERLLKIHGPAGYGFAEDPFGFHMGTVARDRPRLMLEVEYGVSPPTRRRFYGELAAGPAGGARPKLPPPSLAE
jgi:hypothetical protein